MSIVHVDKIWIRIAKKLRCGRPGGGGVVSDFGHPRTRGGGGVKKEQIFADVLYGWPLSHLCYLKLGYLKMAGTKMGNGLKMVKMGNCDYLF